MKRTFDISSLGLHCLAMALMLCDHLWATIVPGNQWLTMVGRLAFPIFAFLIAEGYHYTRDFKKYRRRLLIFAIVSEIPFNLMYAASWIFPFQQNVLWTFLLALQLLRTLDSIREKHPDWKGAALCGLVTVGFYLLGSILSVDYFGYGILTVLVFHLCRGRTWPHRLAQVFFLYLINCQLMRGQQIPVTLFGAAFEVPLQGFALLALPIIWLYRGRQGPRSRWIQLGCYAFYPAHMLVLGLLSM